MGFKLGLDSLLALVEVASAPTLNGAGPRCRWLSRVLGAGCRFCRPTPAVTPASQWLAAIRACFSTTLSTAPVENLFYAFVQRDARDTFDVEPAQKAQWSQESGSHQIGRRQPSALSTPIFCES